MFIDKIPAKKARSGYTYRVRFYYRDEDGNRKVYTKSGFKTKNEARLHGESKMEEYGIELAPDQKMITLRKLYEEWLDLNRGRLANNTIATYGYMFKHLKELEDTDIRSIKYLTLQKLFNSMPLSKSSKQATKALLLNLFKYAYKVEYIKENPIPYIEIYGSDKRETPRVLSQKDVGIICSHLRAESSLKVEAYEVFAWIAYYTGLRISEALALEWKDISFSENKIHVWRRLDGRVLTDRMKTKTSTAFIPLCKPLRIILLKWKEKNPHSLVVTETGNPIPVQTVSNALRHAGERAGITFYPHMLRHSFITHVIRSGVDPKTASMLARHSNSHITLDIYTHLSYEDLSNAMDVAFPE